MKHGDHDVPLLHGSVTIRSPRNVLLLQPFEVALAVVLVVVSVVFTIWPEFLDHAPVSFERRGVVHHAHHYMLLAGAALTVVGMFSAGPRRLRIELAGLCLLTGALGVNLVAEVAHAADADQPASGLDVALRVAAVVGLTVRAYIVATEPTVSLRSNGGE